MKFNITGMGCAACQARIEDSVSKLEGVQSCSVNLLTGVMLVEANCTSQEIIDTVVKAGYGAEEIAPDNNNCISTEEDSTSQGESSSTKTQKSPPSEIKVLKNRLCYSAIFLVALIFLNMSTFSDTTRLIQLFLSTIILIINRKFFISGTKGLLHASPNMDTLVSLGSGISYIYSVIQLFTNITTSTFYFESSAMIVTLITVGKLLEAISKGQTTNALKDLIKLTPKTATIIKDEKEIQVPIDQVKVDDIFVIHPGENVPVDGIIIQGYSSIDEASITGESIPAEKHPDSIVTAGTTTIDGFLTCKATRVGNDTTLAQIIDLVNNATLTKAPIAKIADKVSGIFVPFVMAISVITFLIWTFLHADFSFALTKAISVLVVSCPCALGLATPVAIMVGNGIGAKKGILFKNSTALENAGKIKTVVLDKTGTITKGESRVVYVENEEILQTAMNLESYSLHPFAKAIMHYCAQKNMQRNISALNNFETVSGKGIMLDADGSKSFGGNLAYIQESCPEFAQSTNPETLKKWQEIETKMQEISKQGQTPLLFVKFDAKDTSTPTETGIIAVADVIKKESSKAIKQLQKMGINVIMLSGDNENTANTIANQVGIQKVFASVLPDQKDSIIQELQKDGKVCMVGDGINDAPALTRSDIGIAIGNGTDIAIESADIVLVKNELTDVVNAICLSKKTIKNIKENLFWAFFYNILLIPIAAGVYTKLHIDMNPIFAAGAMSLSSLCVVLNALRLNFSLKDSR